MHRARQQEKFNMKKMGLVGSVNEAGENMSFKYAK